MIEDKTITILAIKDTMDKLVYKGMFEVVWQNKYSQYSEQDKQSCLAVWNLSNIEEQYNALMKEHLKKVTATKLYKVINVPRNDNSQTIFRTQ